LERVGGWVQTKRADFDQQMIARLRADEEPGDPCTFRLLGVPVLGDPLESTQQIVSPGYVYRWQSTGSGHCSGLTRSPESEDWYDRFQPDNHEAVDFLKPRFDDDSQRIMKLSSLPNSYQLRN
jgi:hypothetical protein